MRSVLRLVTIFTVQLIVFLPMCPLYAQVPFRVTKLIGDLNDSPETNEQARRQLREMGTQAIPGLLEEIEQYRRSKTSATIYSVTRCLRAMRELQSDAAVSIATEIIATTIVKPEPLQNERLLLSEALYYLADNFARPEARNAFYLFLNESKEKWYLDHSFSLYMTDGLGYSVNLRTTIIDHTVGVPKKLTRPRPDGRTYSVHLSRWETYKTPSLLINIFYGLEKLVFTKDDRIAEVLTKLLSELPYQFSLCVDEISTDSFTPVAYLDGHDTSSADSLLPDGEGRARIILMRWLRELSSKDSIATIQALLRSEHKDERDYALLVIEGILSEKNP